MGHILFIAGVLRHPRSRLPSYLNQPHSPLELLRHVVLPLSTIRAIAIFARSAVLGNPGAGFVLLVGSYLLQVGTWLGLSLALPVVARLFGTPLSERQAMLIAAVTCAPLWLAGWIFALPEEPMALYVATRIVLVFVASYGFVVMRQAFLVLAPPPHLRLLLVTFAGGAYMMIYLLLFVVLGFSATIFLQVMR